MWYLEPPKLPPRPHDVLNHVQPIDMMLHLPLGQSKTLPISRPAPLPPTETGGKATKATTNTIHMISSTSFPYVSSDVEDPPDLSRHHLHDDGDICKIVFGFTPFHLNHNVESVLPIKDHISSPCLSNDRRLDKGAYTLIDSDGQLLENPRNGLYLILHLTSLMSHFIFFFLFFNIFQKKSNVTTLAAHQKSLGTCSRHLSHLQD